LLGNQHSVVKGQKILDEMDVKAPQVALSTVIGELTLSDDEEFGVDYFLRANKKIAATTNFTGIPPFAGGGTTTSVPGPTAGSTPIVTTTGGSVFDPGKLVSFTQLATNAASGANVGQQSNIEFKRVALQLEVVPLINSEREVSLDILQKLDSLAGTTVVNGNAIPNIATRYVRTNVSAPSGGTIVLGGLITDSKQ